MFQMTEPDKELKRASEKELNKVKTRNLLSKEFKVMIIKILHKL